MEETEGPDEGKTRNADGSSGQSGNRPDFRVVQPEHDQSGKTIFTDVGGMWKNVSKQGNEYYSLKIGELRLLVFANDRK